MAKKMLSGKCAHCGSKNTQIDDSILEDTETLIEKVYCLDCECITYDIWKFVERRKEYE